MFKVGATYATPKGVFGVVTKAEKGVLHVKWDDVPDLKPNTPDQLKWAVDRKLIAYVGYMPSLYA